MENSWRRLVPPPDAPVPDPTPESAIPITMTEREHELTPPPQDKLLALAKAGDGPSFDRLVAPYRRQLGSHCYRMLGSPHDADDALQETMIAAWKGLATFEGRSSLKTWLHQIATNACLRAISKRPKRVMSPDHAPSLADASELGEPVLEPIWLEPLLDDDVLSDLAADVEPGALLQRRENVALAFVAALQHLPGTQRAVLLLREVLEYSAAEVADMLQTSVASINSALQRAQKAVRERLPAVSQSAEQQALGDDALQGLLGAFVREWEQRNVDGLVALLTEDARFTMPPLPAWFDGRAAVARFIVDRLFATPWRLVPLRANGQPGFACYIRMPGQTRYRLGAINLLSIRDGRISAINGFLDPALHGRLGIPPEPPEKNLSPER
ncbi:MAG: RNA polymerase subunit sigma-70 [Vitreoscilla sp.]